MSNVASALQTPQELVLSAFEHLINELKGGDSRLASSVEHHIGQASGHLTDALTRVPGSTAMGVENASAILRHLSHDLARGDKIDPIRLDTTVRSTAGLAAKGAGVLAKLTDAATKTKIGALMIRHPGKAAGIAGLATLTAACLLPGKEREETQADGSVETKKSMGFFKTTAVGLGVVLSSVLLGHFLQGKWPARAAAKAAATLAGRG